MIDIKLIGVSDTKLIPNPPVSFNRISGADALVQRIVKLLLTVPGSDFFSEASGTGLLSLYGVYNEKALNTVKTVLPVMLQNLTESIKQEQQTEITNGTPLEDSELLENILVESISYDIEYGGWLIYLKILNKANNAIKILIP